jgi:predicted helicase
MSLALKPTHAAVKNYYAALNQVGQLHFSNEAQVSDAFAKLLADCGRKLHLTFIPQFPIQRARTRVIVDGALLDTFHLAHGYWEAKDEKDDLDREIKAKLDKGYPRDNIIFQATERAVLYQSGARVADEDISNPDYLAQLVNHFFDYKAPHIEEWEQAVTEFSDRIPELATAVKKIIDEERRRNPAFVHSFEDFYDLCRQAINPNLSAEAVERMLIQHLLTERIFERIFDNPDFTRRNVVAAEIEKVIVELTKRAFNRNEFLRPLDRFYKAIEVSAENTTGFSEKQAFLNKVYERFFQGYSPKEADTHGIVYTPQPIVNFMVRSVEEILQKEFGRSLGDKGVHILDPFVGTGNFIVRIMQEIKATDLQYKYENELHCNEVMLLPYYIASMNIEHAYFERTDEYKAFPGICLVDTFELSESKQVPMFTEQNTQRVERQKQQQIFVIVGNPPYNAWQMNENDNNKNRKYSSLDARVTDTYASHSRAKLLTSLNDPYVKAFRWASDRISKQGIVAFVSNNSFIDQLAFDGVRRTLAQEFDSIYILDLGGNVRKNPKLSGTTHNVFGIQVGVSINLFIRSPHLTTKRGIYYAAVERDWRKEEKYQFLEQRGLASTIDWKVIQPDRQMNWLREGLVENYATFLSIGTKRETESDRTIFGTFSHGINTARDAQVYNFNIRSLQETAKGLCENYNAEVDRWIRAGQTSKIDDFVDYSKIKWSRNLKRKLRNKVHENFDRPKLRRSLYRPFATEHVYFSEVLVDELGRMLVIFPNPESEEENVCISLSAVSAEKPFLALTTNRISNYHLAGAGAGTQCFPFYTYADDGTRRRENITDWALEQFRAHYHDPSITKWNIFHYVYAILNHPDYRQRYAANLRRELPRIPFATYVGFVPTLSSRAEQDRPKDAHAQSRDPVPADTQQRPHEESPPRHANENANQPERRYERLTSEAKERVLSEWKAEQDSGELHYAGQDDARVFHAFAKAGQRLAEIHVHYEQQHDYKLTKVEKKGEKLDYRVTKMKLSKDKTTLIYNQFLTLSGIPKETYEYRLGNRSALEWVIDQYQVSTDKRSGITNDPNRADDQQYILRLIAQVVTVSLETVEIVRSLPSLGLPD